MTDRWTYADGKIFDGDGILLAHVVYDPQTDFRRNCRIIAAAPEMLEALEAMVEMVEMNGFMRDYAMEITREAIQKAGGEE